jgi:hypothetical protein
MSPLGTGPVVCVSATARLFHDAQLNVDITHATINSIGRFIDRLVRMEATIGHGASYNRVLPRVREVRPDPLLTRIDALAIQLIHYVQDIIADL